MIKGFLLACLLFLLCAVVLVWGLLRADDRRPVVSAAEAIAVARMNVMLDCRDDAVAIPYCDGYILLSAQQDCDQSWAVLFASADHRSTRFVAVSRLGDFKELSGQDQLIGNYERTELERVLRGGAPRVLPPFNCDERDRKGEKRPDGGKAS